MTDPGIQVQLTGPSLGEAKKTRSKSAAQETIEQAEKDKRHSFYCGMAANVIVLALLFAYIIYAWIQFASKKDNRQTTVIFSAATSMKFPALYFQSTEYGNLHEINMTLYSTTCKIADRSNGQNIGHVTLHNPTEDEVISNENDWLLLNTSLSYYNFDGYGCRRRMSSNSSSYYYYYDGYTYSDFTNYSAAQYCSSSTSNIYYILPPKKPEFDINTNQHKKCGDIFELKLTVSVPELAFHSLNLSEFMELLYVRSYPDSFGFEYGYNSRDTTLNAYLKKKHIYYDGRLPYGEMKSEALQLIIADDKVDNTYADYYESSASLDYSNLQTNASYKSHGLIYFTCYLFLYGDDFTVEFKTIPASKWYDVFSAIGGMYGTISSPIGFFIAVWLYGISIACIKFEGKAPLDPLPDDLVKRLDGYLADKIIGGELAPGDNWADRKSVV